MYIILTIYSKVYQYGLTISSKNMSKGYVKDANGKYKLVDKREVLTVQEPETQPISLEEIDARLKRLESIVIDPRK